MTEAPTRKAYHAKWYQENKEKHQAAGKLWKASNKKSVSNTWLRYRYGITTEQRDALFISQNSSCAICGSNEAGGLHNKFHVDHCHETDVVRGMLCNSCNLGLGHFKDNTAALRKAATYLEGSHVNVLH